MIETVNEAKYYRWVDANQTDVYHARMNPLKQVVSGCMPQIHCSCDNDTHFYWMDQFLDISDPLLQEVTSPYTAMHAEDWQRFAAEFRLRHGLPEGFALHPGAGISIPEFEITGPTVNDVMWTFRNIIVTRKLADLFDHAGLTGYRMHSGRVRWSRKMLKRGVALPELFVMQVTSYAWRSGSIWRETCPICEAYEYTHGEKRVDQDRWDGSDFFHLDNDHLGVWVSERVKKLLIENKIRNFRLIPVEDELTTEEFDTMYRLGTFTHHPGIPLGYKP